MTTYRVGSHHGVTIIRTGDGARCGRPGHDCERGHLAAVVIDGGDDSAEFAEDICYRLNSPTPDIPYTSGAREALAEVRRRINIAANLGEQLYVSTLHQILLDAAAELCVDEEAPRGPLSAAETVPGHVDGCTGGTTTCICAEPDDEDAPSGPLSATETTQSGPVQGRAWAEAVAAFSGRFSVGIEDEVRLWLSCPQCPWWTALELPLTLAELVQRAGEHTEVCK